MLIRVMNSGTVEITVLREKCPHLSDVANGNQEIILDRPTLHKSFFIQCHESEKSKPACLPACALVAERGYVSIVHNAHNITWL